jgi:hypothetical protein
MIVIVKRDDVRETHREWSVENIQLEHVELPPDLVQQAELIVFVEGSEVKFLKHIPAIQSKNTFDVLLSYIKSKPPKKTKPFSVKDFPNQFRYRKRKE